MPVLISPFDDRFVTLGRAARLAAGWRRGIEADDVKDLLARAIFAGAFDPPALDAFEEEALRQRNAPENWLHVQIAVPPARLMPEQAALRPPPQEYFAANRTTIVSVMQCLGALPGDRAQWEPLLNNRELPDGRMAAFAALAKTPWRHYPPAGREYLETICLPTRKLRRWFKLRMADLPPFLEESEDDAPAAQNVVEFPPLNGRLVGDRAQGRPQKAAWDRIRETAFRLRTENPHMQMKTIAYEARSLAAKDFPDDDLPSVATIQRKLGELLRGGPIH